MKRKQVFLMVVAAAALATVVLPCQGQASSETSAELAELLRRYPEADTNGDGVLTMSEAKAFVQEQLGHGGARRPAEMPPAPDAPSKKIPLPEKDLPRDLDPVILTGKQVQGLLGREPGQIVAFAWKNDAWKQVPVQVDERKKVDLGKACGGESFRTTLYADPRTKLGADPNVKLDMDDEVVFMAKDTGGRTRAADPEGVEADGRTELRIGDPSGGKDRYVYLFASDGSLKADAGIDYVKYKARKAARPARLRQENSVVETNRYRVGFAARWILDRTEVLAGIKKPVDILDGDKFQFLPGISIRTTGTFSRGKGEYLAHIDGPVRAIRSVVGANSGRLTQRDWVFYEGRQDCITYLRVHPIPGTWMYYDFSPAARGMTYYDNLNTGGVTIDGKPDRMHSGRLRWQVVTGKQGTLSMALLTETDLPRVTWKSYYFDQAQANWDQGIGDRHACGASGPATGPLLNTDPTDRSGKCYQLTVRRIVYYQKPNAPLEAALKRIAAAGTPLKVD
ncbi:MAG: hypothetical protein ACLFV7_15205 [Phycisphaerae bacterium]